MKLLVLYPIAAIAMLFEQFFPTQKIIEQSLSTGLRIHILLSIFAYSLLTVGTFQALMLFIQDRFLKTKKASKIIDKLPPENQYLDNSDPEKFIAKMGAEAIQKLLKQIHHIIKFYLKLLIQDKCLQE